MQYSDHSTVFIDNELLDNHLYQVKVLTLMHTTVLFEVVSPEAKNPIARVREYEDLFQLPRKESPKRWKVLRRIWKPLPSRYNTLENREAYRGICYGATSGLPGFLELDYLASTALHHVLRYHKVQRGLFTQRQFRTTMHATWIWMESGIGFATADPYLLEAINLVIRSEKKIMFSNHSKGLQEVISEMRSWNPVIDWPQGSDYDAFQLVKILEWMIPDFSQMGWDQILYLRQNPFAVNFRRWLREQIRQQKKGLAAVRLTKAIQEGLWKLAKSVVPNPATTTIKGFFGNLPLGPIPINPVGIASTVQDVTKSKQLAREFGWLFWLCEARDMLLSLKS